MRLAAALAAALVLVVSGCGSSSRPSASSADGQEAARLVPPYALLFVSVDTNLDSKQWQIVEQATGGLTLLRKSLREQQIELGRDVRPALGDELDVAVLGVENGKAQTIALTQAKDEAKLRALAAKLNQGGEHYDVERVGDWSVVADDASAIDAVRQARSGRSLADVNNFKHAMAAVRGDAVARLYADGAGLERVPRLLNTLVRVAGTPGWIGARLFAEGNALRLDLRLESPVPASSVYRPTLLRDVPSGAILALSFKDLDRPLGRLAGDRALQRAIQRYVGLRATDLAPALRGEGAFYVLPGAVIPPFALEVQSPNPDAAVRSLRRVATRVRAATGSALAVRVARYGSRVVLTDAPLNVPRPAGSLVNDQPFKDAVAAADVPGEVTFLAYADVQRLAPLVQAFASVVGQAPPSATTLQRLDRLGSVVAYGARTGSILRLEVRLTIR